MFGLSLTNRAACTTSSGYVEAIMTWATSGSGYSAIGAATCSSCSGVKGVVVPAGWAVAGNGTPSISTSSHARSLERSIVVIHASDQVSLPVDDQPELVP